MFPDRFFLSRPLSPCPACCTAPLSSCACLQLVYVNDLLSSGDIPDLFAVEDREEIIGAMRGETKARGLPDTNDNCWHVFIQRVCFSSRGG